MCQHIRYAFLDAEHDLIKVLLEIHEKVVEDHVRQEKMDQGALDQSGALQMLSSVVVGALFSTLWDNNVDGSSETFVGDWLSKPSQQLFMDAPLICSRCS